MRHCSQVVGHGHLSVASPLRQRLQAVTDHLPARPPMALGASNVNFDHLTPPMIFLLAEVAQKLVDIRVGTINRVVEAIVPAFHTIVGPSMAAEGPVELVPLMFLPVDLG